MLRELQMVFTVDTLVIQLQVYHSSFIFDNILEKYISLFLYQELMWQILVMFYLNF
ncbi:hypothetical protein Hanom_Chr01g00009091 [Helianthus anomalus]